MQVHIVDDDADCLTDRSWRSYHAAAELWQPELHDGQIPVATILCSQA